MNRCDALMGDVRCTSLKGHSDDHCNGFLYWDDEGAWHTFPAQRPTTGNDWDCELQGHLWHSNIIAKVKVLESDWCVVDGTVRPGYMDPREKWNDLHADSDRQVP